METIAVVSSKGGVAKSTLALNLGAASVEQRRSTVLFDLDPQETLYDWSKLRPLANPPVVAGSSEKLAAFLDVARKEERDTVIVDTQGSAGRSASVAINLCDTVLILARVGVADILAMRHTVELIDAGKARGKCHAVLTQVPTSGNEETEARAALVSIGLPVLDTVMHERKVFRASMVAGSSAIETEPKGKAAAEIRNLWAEIQSLEAK